MIPGRGQGQVPWLAAAQGQSHFRRQGMEQHNGLERRMSQRMPMALGIKVYAYGTLVASGMTVDMSEHGVLLRIQQDFSDDELDPGKHLDVMLECTEEASKEKWLPIKVVRKCEGGIAASFVGLALQSA